MDFDFLDATPILSKGSHGPGEGKLCLWEAAAFLAGEPHSDKPECGSPCLIKYGQRLNDRLDHERRQELAELLPYLIGSRNDALERQRAEYIVRRTVNGILPTIFPNHRAALQSAQTMAECRAIALIVKRKAAAAADAAYAAAAAADAADAAAAAAAAAAYAADAAYAAASAYADAARIHTLAISIFRGALFLDPELKPRPIQPEVFSRMIEYAGSTNG